MRRFEVIEHTADSGIVAYGHDKRDLFANAAYGLFSLISDLDKVGESHSREVTVTAGDDEQLLVEWLNELIFLFDVEHVLLKRFDIAELDGRLRATVRGERVDESRHTIDMAPKATTYHMLRVERTPDGWRAQVIFDI